jgi:hypothetical protein
MPQRPAKTSQGEAAPGPMGSPRDLPLQNDPGVIARQDNCLVAKIAYQTVVTLDGGLELSGIHLQHLAGVAGPGLIKVGRRPSFAKHDAGIGQFLENGVGHTPTIGDPA